MFVVLFIVITHTHELTDIRQIEHGCPAIVVRLDEPLGDIGIDSLLALAKNPANILYG